MVERLNSSGKCWCGCGSQTKAGRFFIPGHDRAAEAAVIEAEHGGVPEFLEALGYGPDGKNPMAARDKRRAEVSPRRGRV